MYLPSHRPFKPRTTAFPVKPPALRFAPLPPRALPLLANNTVANNVNLLPLSPPEFFYFVFVPLLIHPPPPQNRCQPPYFLIITHAAPALPDPNVWHFPAAVPSNAVALVGTTVNIHTVQPALLSNPQVHTLLRSSILVQAAAVSQNYVTSDFMQANPFSSSTGIAPTFVTPIIPPTYGATVPNPLCCGGPSHPLPLAPSLDSEDLMKQLADAITCKKNVPLSGWKW